MKRIAGISQRGFTLIELLSAVLILSLLALMSYRGLVAVLDARSQVAREAGKWRQVAAFLVRFESDMQLAVPRPVRTVLGVAPAWLGRAEAESGPRLEFSRFASFEGIDAPQRIAYRLNQKQEIELWLWSELDPAANALPTRYPLLSGVIQLGFQYLNADQVWVDAWPSSPRDTPIPRATRLNIVLASGEEIVRVFALTS